MELVDTHCHLQFKDYKDPNQIIEAAREAGVTKLICVGTTLADSTQAIEIAVGNEGVWAAVGVHPHDAKALDPSKLAAEIKALLIKPKVVAVGEIGLDFYKNYSPRDEQIKVLKAQIEASLAYDLPYIFHVREAFDEFWPIFDAYPGLRGVIHSFSSSEQDLEQILKRGLYVGLNGIMTFTKDIGQLAAAKKVPADKLLLETDAPFLAPASLRGKTCEPKHVRLVAEFLADLRGESWAELAATTTHNSERLFGL